MGRRAAIHLLRRRWLWKWATRMMPYAPRPATPEPASNAVGNVQAEVSIHTAAQKTGELLAVIADLRQRYGNWKMEWGDIALSAADGKDRGKTYE